MCFPSITSRPSAQGWGRDNRRLDVFIETGAFGGHGQVLQPNNKYWKVETAVWIVVSTF